MSTVRPIEIAKNLAMINAKRFVNIRGYVKEVTVSGRSLNSINYWHVSNDGKRELVHEDAFYHRDISSGTLVARDTEFKRKYGKHDVRIENLPSNNHALLWNLLTRVRQ